MDVISFDATGWQLQPDAEPNTLRWFNKQDDRIVLQYATVPPNIPRTIKEIRAYFRDSLGSDGGLLEVEFVKIDDFPAVKVFFKLAQQPHGMAYICTFIFPRQGAWYNLKFQAAEQGNTGFREAIISDKLARAKKGLFGRQPKWAEDPYEPSYQGKIMRNLADDPTYDAQFPDHPLSRIRREMATVQPTIRVPASIKSMPPYLP